MMYIIDLFSDNETIVVTHEIKEEVVKQQLTKFIPSPELQIVQIEHVDNEK